MKTLLLPKFNITAPVEDYELVIRLDEKYTEPNDILAFIPNRPIVSRANANFCFIPYGPNSWNHKQNARGIGCQLGDDRFIELDTDVTYPLHQQVGLHHNEEIHILLLSLLFFLNDDAIQEKLEITLYENVEMSSTENNYLQQMIKDKLVKLF